MRNTITVFCLILVIKIASQVPTCSLDPVFIAMNKYGIWPDSATNFISGTVGISYHQNITVKVPLDTATQIGNFCFNRIVVSTPSNVSNYNLPPGLMFGSSTASLSNGTVNGAPSLKFPGNANNCASIYGTPTQSGTFVLSFKVDTYASLSFGNCPSNPNINGGTNLNTTYINYYKIVVYPATSLSEWNKNPFESSRVLLFPNPGITTSLLQFNTPFEMPYQCMVYDMQGRMMQFYTGRSINGENRVTLKVEGLSSGIYLVVLKVNGAQFRLKWQVNAN